MADVSSPHQRMLATGVPAEQERFDSGLQVEAGIDLVVGVE